MGNIIGITMAIKLDLLSDLSVSARTKPGQDGKSKRLIAELDKFKDNPEVEGIKLRYSFGQGKGIYYTLSYADIYHLIQMITNALRSKEPVTETLPQTAKNRPDILLEVGRNSNLEPFIRLRGAGKDGQPLNKEFYFGLANNKKTILRNGQPIPDLELQERCAAVFTKTFTVYARALEENYVKREWQPGGYGNNNNYPQYGQQSQAAPKTNANYDDILD